MRALLEKDCLRLKILKRQKSLLSFKKESKTKKINTSGPAGRWKIAG